MAAAIWGFTIGLVVTPVLIGLAYLTSRSGESGAWVIWWLLCQPLHSVCSMVNLISQTLDHYHLNILVSSLVNGILVAAVFALF